MIAKILFYLLFILPFCSQALAATASEFTGDVRAVGPLTVQENLVFAALNATVAGAGAVPPPAVAPPAVRESIEMTTYDMLYAMNHLQMLNVPPPPQPPPSISNREHLRNIGKACLWGGWLYLEGMQISPTSMTRTCAYCCEPVAWCSGAAAGCLCAVPWAVATPCVSEEQKRELAAAVIPTSGSVLIADLLCCGLCCPLSFLWR